MTTGADAWAGESQCKGRSAKPTVTSGGGADGPQAGGRRAKGGLRASGL